MEKRPKAENKKSLPMPSAKSLFALPLTLAMAAGALIGIGKDVLIKIDAEQQGNLLPYEAPSISVISSMLVGAIVSDAEAASCAPYSSLTTC